MRWFLYLLATSNAVFLYMNVEAARRTAVPPSPPAFDTVRQLLLIGEIDPTELRRRGATEVADEATESVAVAGAVVAESGTDSGTGGAAAEHASNSAAAGAEAASADATATAGSTAVACYSAGPIAEPDVEKRVAAWLDASAGLSPERREGQRREVSRYWVHLAPSPDLAAARAISATLTAKGVDDLHVIARGNMANTLSLGVYGRKASMERRVEQLRALGHEPVVTERLKVAKTAWLEGRLPVDGQFPTEAFEKQFGDVPLRVGACSRAGKLLRASALPRITRPGSG